MDLVVRGQCGGSRIRAGEKAFTFAFCFSPSRGLNERMVGSTAVSSSVTKDRRPLLVLLFRTHENL